MLRRLLRYDFLSVWRTWWIVAIVMPVMALAGSVSLRLALEIQESLTVTAMMSIATAFLVLLFVCCIFGMVAAVCLTEFLLFFRFYRNFFTDEGYLTFTLPVSRRDLLLSKTINALLWQVIQGVMLALCIALMCLVIPSASNGALLNPVVFKGLWSFLTMLWKAVGPWLIVYLLEGILFCLLGSGFSVALLHFCITVGGIIAQKHKLLASVGVYYAVNAVLNLVIQLIWVLLSLSLPGSEAVFSNLTQARGCALVALLLLFVCLLTALVGCVFYFMTRSRLERKLNLN